MNVELKIMNIHFFCDKLARVLDLLMICNSSSCSGACGVMVIIAGYEHSDMSSNPGPD